jgi:uncharacterized membrane protein (DUF373 family)
LASVPEQMDDEEEEKGRSPIRPRRVARPAGRVLQVAENLVYTVAGTLLVGGAVLVLMVASYHLVQDVSQGVDKAVTDALDRLLLVFILLELLAAVRTTMVEHKLVAEPFLVAGIIAVIKEIIVLALQAKDVRGKEEGAFQDLLMEIGVLGGMVLLLSIATYLVRLKEREPEEEDEEEARKTTAGDRSS